MPAVLPNALFRNLMAFRTWRFDLSQFQAAVKRRYVKVGNDWISRADSNVNSRLSVDTGQGTEASPLVWWPTAASR